MRIEKVEAYAVNLMDKKGTRLWSEKDVTDHVENALGEVIDSLGLGSFFGISERLALHAALMPKLKAIARISEIQDAFNAAKESASPFD